MKQKAAHGKIQRILRLVSNSLSFPNQYDDISLRNARDSSRLSGKPYQALSFATTLIANPLSTADDHRKLVELLLFTHQTKKLSGKSRRLWRGFLMTR